MSAATRYFFVPSEFPPRPPSASTGRLVATVGGLPNALGAMPVGRPAAEKLFGHLAVEDARRLAHGRRHRRAALLDCELLVSRLSHLWQAAG